MALQPLFIRDWKLLSAYITMKLANTFFLFCENTGIKVLESKPVQYGVKYKVSRHGEEAYMTLYDNGNSMPQGSLNGSLLKLLQVWSCTVPRQRKITEEEAKQISSSGMPAFYLSWREWKEDAGILKKYIKDHGIPIEEYAPEDYKMRREIMFHDYMFKKATELNISISSIKHIIKSWINRFCFMNINSERLADEVISRIMQNYRDEVTEDGYVSFYAVTEELAYVFTHFCQAKWMLCDNMTTCPQTNDSVDCLVDLVDSMYVYCQNQRVLAYNKTNLEKLLKRDFDNLSWIDLRAKTPIEAILGDALYQSGLLNIPQFQALSPDRRFKVDFMVKAPHGGAIAIECDGLEYHANATAYQKDRQRDNLLTNHGFQVLRFSSIDIFNDLQGCINQIEYTFSNFQHGRVVYHRNGGLGYFGANI